MMQRVLYVTCLLFANLVHAQEKIAFKSTFVPKQGWLIYAITILSLLAITAFLARKAKLSAVEQPSICRILDKKYLANKTMLYIVEYQQQRFLIADNQQSLVLQILDSELYHDS